MKLYGYWRSSATYRVRIALSYKGLEYSTVPVHLLDHGGEQHRPSYKALQPQELVPTLVDEDGDVFFQSLAIIEYLEERYPDPPLYPSAPKERAFARAFALAIACDIHPLNNLRVLRYLEEQMGISPEGRTQWIRHWTEEGLRACEAMLAVRSTPGPFVCGANPCVADVCLIPQLYNARRFGCDLSGCGRLLSIEKHALSLPCFANARPEHQPDAPRQGS